MLPQRPSLVAVWSAKCAFISQAGQHPWVGRVVQVRSGIYAIYGICEISSYWGVAVAKNDYDDDWAYLWLSGVWSLGQQLVSQRSSRSESREQVVICRSGAAKGHRIWVYFLGGFQMQICTRQCRLSHLMIALFSFVLASGCIGWQTGISRIFVYKYG